MVVHNNKNLVTVPLKNHFIAMMSMSRAEVVDSHTKKQKCARSFPCSAHKLNDIIFLLYTESERCVLQMSETND